MDYRIDDRDGHSELFSDPDDYLAVCPEPGFGLTIFPRSEQIGKPLENLNIADPREQELNEFIVPTGVRIYKLLCQIMTSC